MSKLLFPLLVSSVLLAQDASRSQTTPASPQSEQREFVIPNFHTEAGKTLPEAHIVYGTYGHLNPARDNAVLLPSHYMANFRGYEWLIGPVRALDTTRLFLVATELFGNGRSSSPSNTPEPFHGPRFPVMTIRDNVEAVHLLLTKELKIAHLRALIGFSMGAEQALRSIKVPLLYMRSETDLYFPVGDARYEAAFIPGVSLVPIPSLWGHTAGAASNPADGKFFNENISGFLAQR
jgi:homoserine acetyltransferase